MDSGSDGDRHSARILPGPRQQLTEGSITVTGSKQPQAVIWLMEIAA